MLEDGERLPALIESLAAPDPEEARIPISQYLWIVKRHRWKILGFCAATAIATVIISARLTPIFESTTTVDVDRRTPPGVVGPEAALSAVNDAVADGSVFAFWLCASCAQEAQDQGGSVLHGQAAIAGDTRSDPRYDRALEIARRRRGMRRVK